MNNARSENGSDIRSSNHEGIGRRDLLRGGGALLAASAVTVWQQSGKISI